MDDLARVVLHILASHVGPEQYISRPDLLNMVNAELETEYGDDRTIRDAIEWLRANHQVGALISAIFPSKGMPSGYFVARDEAEAREYMKPDYSRLNRLRERLSAQEQQLNQSESTQIGMPL